MSLQFPSWLSWYKKPAYVDIRQYADKKAQVSSVPSSPRSSTDSNGSRPARDIPKKLRLEKILKNETCSPMSMYDFYMYLKHIEHSPENLEFYVWFKNYEAGRLTGNLSRPHSKSGNTNSEFDFPDSQSSITYHEKSGNLSVTESQEHFNMEQADMYAQISGLVDPGCGPACTTKSQGPFAKIGKKFRNRHNNEDNDETEDVEIACVNLSNLISDQEQARRTELESIKSLFLLPGAPKELNIPAPMRNKCLEAISTSTDAANLKPVADHCYLLLKSCSHRNFIRLGVSNGTFETVCMATGLGIVLTVTGLLAMFLLAFASPSIHHGNRWRALGIWPMWSIGVGLILSGLRGSCFFLLLFSRRQPLPWEKFEDDASFSSKRSGLMSFFSKLMIFDRKLKVKDDNLRYLQRKIVIQSVLGGMIFATLMEILFICLPIWKPVH